MDINGDNVEIKTVEAGEDTVTQKNTIKQKDIVAAKKAEEVTEAKPKAEAEAVETENDIL